MTEREAREGKFLQHATTYERSHVLANRKRLFEAANYLLCELALQIEEIERTNANDDDGKQPEQSE